jgi:hypothetical protein
MNLFLFHLFHDLFLKWQGPSENAIYDDNDVPRSVFAALCARFDVVVDQAEWNELSVVSYHDNAVHKRACVNIMAKKSMDAAYLLSR